MNIKDAFPSKYFKTTDLAEKPQLMTIGSVRVETVDDDTAEQIVRPNQYANDFR